MKVFLIATAVGIVSGIILTTALLIVSGLTKKTEKSALGTIAIFGLNPMIVYFIGAAIGFYLALKFSK